MMIGKTHYDPNCNCKSCKRITEDNAELAGTNDLQLNISDALIHVEAGVTTAEQAEKWIIEYIDDEISKLMQEFVNIPISKRSSGWDWLLKLRKRL